MLFQYKKETKFSVMKFIFPVATFDEGRKTSCWGLHVACISGEITSQLLYLIS
jgi:hypothetical protein